MTSFLVAAAILVWAVSTFRAFKKSRENRQLNGIRLDSRELTRILLESLQSVIPSTEQTTRAPNPEPRGVSKSNTKHPKEKRANPPSNKRKSRTTRKPKVVDSTSLKPPKRARQTNTSHRARKVRKTNNTSKRYDKFIVIDFETTGKDWPYYAVEAAWIEVDENLNEICSLESLIEPPVPIPAETSKIHGIYDDDVAEKPTIDEFFYELSDDRFSSLSVCVIGHNVFFDLRLFEPYCGSCQPLCTCSASRLHFPKLYNHKLQTLVRHLDISGQQSHRAMDDARLSLEVLRSLNTDLQMSIPELVEFALTPPEDCVMPWGKHRGTSVSQLPTSYLKWLLPNTNPDYLRVAVQQELALRTGRQVRN